MAGSRRFPSYDVQRDVAEAGEEGGPEEEVPSSQAIDAETAGNTAEEGEDCVEGVHEQLLVCASYSDVLEHHRHKITKGCQKLRMDNPSVLRT